MTESLLQDYSRFIGLSGEGLPRIHQAGTGSELPIAFRRLVCTHGVIPWLRVVKR